MNGDLMKEIRHADVDGHRFKLVLSPTGIQGADAWHVYGPPPGEPDKERDLGTIEDARDGFEVANLYLHGDIAANEDLLRRVAAAAGITVRPHRNLRGSHAE
jgi:hypothetical protein